MTYCIDTSALIEGWVRRYPPDIFPDLWKELDRLIASGGLIAPDEVLHELKKKEDGLFEWAKQRPNLFCPIDVDIQKKVSEVLTVFPRLVDTRKYRNSADPFVIALALVRQGTVITQEPMTGNKDKPNIPDVCNHYGIRPLTIMEFIREMAWKFVIE